MPSSDTQFKPVHGMSINPDGSRDPTYTAWRSMRRRVFDPLHKSFSDYGGRGISICARWDDFSAFLADMGKKPHRLTLGRIDNDGDYEPVNCRWETWNAQARNRRSTVILEAFGARAPLVEMAERFGIRPDTLQWRIKRKGMSVESALTTPVGPYQRQSSVSAETLHPAERLIATKNEQGLNVYRVIDVVPAVWPE